MIRPIYLALLGGAVTALSASPAVADHGAAGTGGNSSGPLVGASAATMPEGKAAITLALTLAKPEDRSDAELASLAGRHIHAHDQDHAEAYLLGLSYGLTDNLTLSASLPYVRRLAIHEGAHSHVGGQAINGVVDRGNSVGLGDAALLAKWRFTGEHHHGWEAAVLAGLKLPTGSNTRVDALGEMFETEHQPGTGSWDPILGLAASRPLPRGCIDLSVIYQIATRGAHDTRLGDRAQAAIGLTWRLAGGQIDYHGEHHHDTGRGGATLDGVIELNGEWEGRQHESGTIDIYSGGKALFFSPGLRLTTGRWSFAVGGGVPVAQDIALSHPSTRFRARFAIGRAL
ncbi:MAG TPA: transporter [Novosphingobium sp.]|nr:transporter [Novosphingobium sp.]